MYDNLPKRIRVGPFDVSVEVTKLDTHDEYCWGTFDDNQQLMRLDTTPPPSSAFAVDTVLHELSHSIYKWSGLKPGDDEERVVATFATWLTMICRDNPKLIEWILATVREGQ